MRRRVLLPSLLLVVAVTAACAPTKKGAPPGGVVLWGDSFGEQVAPLLPYEEHYFGGTAPCHWLPEIRWHAAVRPPAVAVLLFAGSTMPCGGLDRYVPDTLEAIRVLEAAGTCVFVLAAPCVKPGPGVPEVNPIYTSGGVPLAWGPHDSVCPGGVYTEAYRLSDQHLNATGVARFAYEIRALAG
jgi:hypothetical protein